MIRKLFLLVPLLAVAPLLSAQTQINGAGSTFIYPMMSKWANEYLKEKPQVQINYQSIGSGGGIRQISEGTVDFGATDGPMTDEQLAASKVGKILHIPVVMGAAVPAYNLPGVSQKLKFTPSMLAGIFLGTIKTWNDPQIAAANPGVSLPDTQIVVVHRSDGSGTSYIWTDYLSKVSSQWESQVGRGTSVKWPVGLGAKGNEGVAGMVRQVPGALGYVELIYAIQNQIPFGTVRNHAGADVTASVASVTAAAASAKVPPDFRYSITDAPGKDAYPISGSTWLLIPVVPRDAAKGALLKEFVTWVLGPGQDMESALDYAKLPDSLLVRVKAALQRIQAK
jgi:phosphate transport system substrate-binding protein